MRFHKNVAGAILFIATATQGTLVYSTTLARPQPFWPNTKIEASRSTSTILADEPPSTPQPTAAPTPTLVPTLMSVPKPKPKAVAARVPSSHVPSDREAIMRAAGIAESDFQYVVYIMAHENGAWEPCKRNGGDIDCTYTGPKSYGICQSKPGSKMAAFGDDWQTNPITQMKWCNSYAISRYKGWANAYYAWIKQQWW